MCAGWVHGGRSLYSSSRYKRGTRIIPADPKGEKRRGMIVGGGLFTSIPGVLFNTLVAVTPRAFTRTYANRSVPKTYRCSRRTTANVNIIVLIFNIITLFITPRVHVNLGVTTTTSTLLLLTMPAFLVNVYGNTVVRYHVIVLPALVILNILAVIFTTVTV